LQNEHIFCYFWVNYNYCKSSSKRLFFCKTFAFLSTSPLDFFSKFVQKLAGKFFLPQKVGKFRSFRKSKASSALSFIVIFAQKSMPFFYTWNL